jgi:hypothetical protein
MDEERRTAVTRALRDDFGLVAPFMPEEYQAARIRYSRPERLAPRCMATARRGLYAVPDTGARTPIEQEHMRLHHQGHQVMQHVPHPRHGYSAEQEVEAESVADILMAHEYGGGVHDDDD